MKATSSDTGAQIISLLSAGHSLRHIACQAHCGVNTVSRIWSEHLADAPRAAGGQPSKLTPTNVHHAIHLLGSGRAKNAVQVTREHRDITNTSLTPQTVRRHLRKAGSESVVKKKKPLLSARHRKGRLDHATTHQDWVVGLEEGHLVRPRSTELGQMEGFGAGNCQERGPQTG